MDRLRNFPDNDLIFDEEQTRHILLFFFPPDKDTIYKLPIDNAVRNFAQGLLVEAVDASYSMGYVEAVFMTIYDFLVSRKLTKGYVDFMKTLAKKAMKHWFKHAKQKDLMHAKIYESVRLKIQSHFRSNLQAIAQVVAKVKGRSIPSTTVPCEYDKRTPDIAWG